MVLDVKKKCQMSEENKQNIESEEQIQDQAIENQPVEENMDAFGAEENGDDTSKLQSELAEAKDKYLRLFAEFDNFKKRSMRERLDYMKTAAQDTLQALLPVADDFERAKKAADVPGSAETFPEGVTLVFNKFMGILEAKGLKAMESTGQDFDAEKHEAVTEIPAPSPELVGKVVDTIEKGYYLQDKIIRYAKVVVGK
jgi:molecular chaperone GrpE